MPINYKLYHPRWHLISRFLRQYRAKNCCESCGAPNHSVGYRDKKGKWITLEDLKRDNPEPGFDLFGNEVSLWPVNVRPYKNILTVAHLDRNTNNNSFLNLAVFCVYCHLNYDREDNQRRMKINRLVKSGQLLLFNSKWNEGAFIEIKISYSELLIGGENF